MAARPRHRLLLLSGLGCWLLAAAGGMAVLWAYGATAGTPAEPPARWPAMSTVAREPGRPTLLVFAHPHCPCTRATVEELDRLLASVDVPPQVHVLFTRPDGTEPTWERTDLWRRAATAAPASGWRSPSAWRA